MSRCPKGAKCISDTDRPGFISLPRRFLAGCLWQVAKLLRGCASSFVMGIIASTLESCHKNERWWVICLGHSLVKEGISQTVTVIIEWHSSELVSLSWIINTTLPSTQGSVKKRFWNCWTGQRSIATLSTQQKEAAAFNNLQGGKKPSLEFSSRPCSAQEFSTILLPKSPWNSVLRLLYIKQMVLTKW